MIIQRSRRVPAIHAIAALSVVFGARPTGAQTANNVSTNLEQFNRQLEQIQREIRVQADLSVPLDQRALIDYGGYLSSLVLSTENSAQNATMLLQEDLVGYARVNLDGAHEFFARGRFTYREFFEGHNPLGSDDDTDSTIDRLYYRFDLGRYLESQTGKTQSADLAVQVGRQLVNWGNGLTLSEEVDGGIADVTFGNASVELLAARTRDDIADIDPFRPHSTHDTKRLFLGALASYQFPKHKPYIYFLNQNDQNDRDTLNFTTSAGTLSTAFHYDSYYIGVGSTGGITDNLVYQAEFVFEGGRSLSASSGATSTQTTDDIRAFAADLRLEYLLQDKRNSRASMEAIAATGDADRGNSSTAFGGNRPHTQDNAFQGFGLINTGFAFAPTVTNLLALRTGLSTFPFADKIALRRLQLGTDVFLYSKWQHEAPIEEATHNDWWLGTELDVYATWQLTSDVSLLVRYGIFFPGSALVGDSDPRNFVAVGVTYAF